MKIITSFILLNVALLVWACSGNVNDTGNHSETVEQEPIVQEKNPAVSEHEEKGAAVVQAVQDNLKMALKSALQDKSPVEAIGVCNESALALTSALNDSLNVEVIRISLKYRNPANKPNGQQARVLAQYEKDLQEGKPIEPKVVSGKESTYYYSPIKMGAFCLTCHGDANQISPELSAELDRLYPEDLARGYEEGQLRGMWTVKFYYL